MRNIDYKHVEITDGFWRERQRINRKITIPAVWNRFCETGRVESFSCAWQEGMPNMPGLAYDSDVAKWIEGVAYTLWRQPDAELEAKVESVIDRMETAQEADGYFNVYYQVKEQDQRFRNRKGHELYSAGHLVEAAVAYYEVTGKRRFLELVEKQIDCIDKAFLKEKTAAFATSGHEEIELALIKLYRCTGKKRYLEMACEFLDLRGNNDLDDKSANCQSHLPVREQLEARGHAVRACYLYCAMADAAAQTGDAALEKACTALFNDIVSHKMYITGGIGSTPVGEAFTCAYDLPNAVGYGETCAAISLAMFAERMQELENHSLFADIVERVMYNGFLSGISLNGDAFFYENPLEINLQQHARYREDDEYLQWREHLPQAQRSRIFACSCCPPNICRFIASVGGYLYACEGKTLYVNQFVSSVMETDGMHVEQKTNYPVSGTVEICAENTDSVRIRIPRWCRQFEIDRPYRLCNGYAEVEGGGRITLCMEMQPFAVSAAPEVRACAGKVAVQRGPVVYCAEGVDQKDLYALHIKMPFAAQEQEPIIGGIPSLCVQALKKQPQSELYCEASDRFLAAELQMIPYFAFANRGESDMLVWLPMMTDV